MLAELKTLLADPALQDCDPPPAVDYPTNLSFYADASNAGHGKNAGVSYRVGTNDWLPLGTFPVSTNGAAVSFSLLGAPDLSTNAGVQFQFTSTFTTWYLDDVVVRGGKFTDLPPLLAPIGPRAVALSNALTIAVTAMDVDRDEIVLAASNLPPGATFVAATNSLISLRRRKAAKSTCSVRMSRKGL